MAERDSSVWHAARKKMPDGMKWCSWHKAPGRLALFGVCNTSKSGLRQICRLGSREAKRKRQLDANPLYVPRTIYIKPDCEVPLGKRWCNHHSCFCDTRSFSKSDTNQDGLKGSCRKAVSERGFKNNGQTRLIVTKYNPPPSGMSWCSYHSTFEPIESFAERTPSAKTKSPVQGFCRIGEKEYRIVNFESAHARGHKRRAKLSGGLTNFKAADIADIRRMQGDRCAYCRIDLKGRGCRDHIMPVKLNGTNDRRNIQLTCRRCNLRKGSKHPLVFARSLGWLL